MLPVLARRSRVSESPFDLLSPGVGTMFDRLMANGNGDDVATYPVDIKETDDALVVEAEMPGFKRDEITVTLEGGILNISGERKTEKTSGTEHLKERRYTRISRSFTVPSTLDDSKVDAKLEDGVLKLRLPKTDAVKAKRIAIR